MIIVRAPYRISFVGGGTDLPDFFHQYPGQVLSATIDKFIYLIINEKQFEKTFTMKYNMVEVVNHPSELKHDRLRAALLEYGLTENGIEFATFADVPARTGLGSSSSFSVALVKGLHALMGKTISKEDAAREACHLEIDLLKEPIGKQDQYAAAYGGFNTIRFNSDDSVEVDPVLIDYKNRASLEQHLMLFFTGITRDASTVLDDQNKKIQDNFSTYKQMSDSVPVFREKLLVGDIQGMGEMLHEGWMKKKTLSQNVSSTLIDTLYDTGIAAGAWGGKILGAGGGGCLLLLAPKEKQPNVREKLLAAAATHGLVDFKEFPVKFTQSGADILFTTNSVIRQ